eukprot:TRINITY_DN29540_c0_g1_i1.p1 TRINITY_DN29540_c0_g1~~TRINITY_DN29540_c0_g1_i1.p1  ORF type:complete len:877 (+),score=389.52 TRINITY_DN29540_c0_g1_i1:42-2633(+)
MTCRNDAYKALIPKAISKDTDIGKWSKEYQCNAIDVLTVFGEDAQKALLRLVVDLLEGVVSGNFTGELTEADKEERKEIYQFAEESKEAYGVCMDALTVDGEVCNHNSVYPQFLVALNVLVEAEIQTSYPCIYMWRARTYFIHQRLLSHLAHALLNRILQCFAEILKLPSAASEPDFDDIYSLTTHAEMYLVKGLVHYYYHEPHHSNDCIQKAQELSGMKSVLTSMMGVRTEHQKFETAQLLVKAQSAKEDVQHEEYPFKPSLVEGSNVLARPRTLKENIEAGGVVDDGTCTFGNGEEVKDDVTDTVLTPFEQSLVMGLCVNVRNNNPMHGLTEVERLPYLERLFLEEKMPWVLCSQVYLLRSRMEQKRVRVRERGLMQFCELCDQFCHLVKDEQGQVIEKSSLHRLKNFWVVLFPPNFALKTELAGIYEKIGLLKSALDIHEALGNWSDVIKCCRRLDKRTKAESLIRARLEETPENPLLWSSLGDATRNEEYYLKAWEMSNHKLAAPMRGLGELYLEVEKFKEAVECFDKALQLNPVFGADWFSMGWAALKTQQWERAAYCYTRNVQMDMEDGHSWSNLANCNLQLNKLLPAFHCLVQAKKWSPANWRIWDNLYTVSVEIGEKTTAINTLTEILDSKGREYKVRAPVLDTLMNQVLDVIAGKADVARTAEQVKQECPEEMDDEIFDVVPFGADMDLDMEDTLQWREEQAKRKQQQAIDVEKARLAAAAKIKQDMHKLLGKVTSITTTEAALYKIFGDYLDGIDNHLEAFDQRLKDLRCQTKKNWQVDRKSAISVIESATRVINGAKLVSEEVLEQRKVKTTPPKTQAIMQVQPVLKLAEEYASLEEYAMLKEAVESLSESS